MARIWASVAVLMSIGTMAPVLDAVVEAVPEAPVGVVVTVDETAVVEPAAMVVSVMASDLAVQATTATTAQNVNDVRRLMMGIMRLLVGVVPDGHNCRPIRASQAATARPALMQESHRAALSKAVAI